MDGVEQENNILIQDSYTYYFLSADTITVIQRVSFCVRFLIIAGIYASY